MSARLARAAGSAAQTVAGLVYLRPFILRCPLRSVSSRFAGDRGFCLADPPKENASEAACVLVIETKVGALFHHIQGEVKILQDCWFGLVAHIAAIVRAPARQSRLRRSRVSAS